MRERSRGRMNTLPKRVKRSNVAEGSNERTIGSGVFVCITRHLPAGDG
jgi:hypothetical protein